MVLIIEKVKSAMVLAVCANYHCGLFYMASSSFSAAQVQPLFLTWLYPPWQVIPLFYQAAAEDMQKAHSVRNAVGFWCFVAYSSMNLMNIAAACARVAVAVGLIIPFSSPSMMPSATAQRMAS